MTEQQTQKVEYGGKPESLHACPGCGECRMYFPDVKGDWGYKDTTRYECWNCGRCWDAKFIKQAQLSIQAS